MPRIAQLLGDTPKRLRPRFASGIVEAANPLDAEVSRTLGRQGSRLSPSQPGEPPRRQSGNLQRDTRAKANPADLSLSVTTSVVGVVLNVGRRDGSIKPRPWLKAAVEANHADRRRLIFGQ